MQGIRRHFAPIFVGSLIIGGLCAYYIPTYQCDRVGAVFCQICAIVGYIAYAVAGLLAIYSYAQMFKRCCKECCEWCILKLRRDRIAISQPLLRESIQQPQNHRQNEIEIQDDESIPDMAAQEQPEQVAEPQEEEQPYENEIWEQYPHDQAMYYRHSSIRSTFNQNQCTICLEQFKEEDAIDRLACRHKFHTLCITDWLSRHQSCPVCRIQLD